jgi:hypothetical protein
MYLLERVLRKFGHMQSIPLPRHPVESAVSSPVQAIALIRLQCTLPVTGFGC